MTVSRGHPPWYGCLFSFAHSTYKYCSERKGRPFMVTRTKHKRELWESISDYHFDNLVPVHLVDRVREMFGGSDHSTRAFANKLTRKLGWDAGFALIDPPEKVTASASCGEMKLSPAATFRTAFTSIRGSSPFQT